MRASLAPSSLSPTAPTPSPAIGSLCRVAGFSKPIVQTGSLRIDRFDLSGHNTGIRRYTADSSDDAPATGTASTCFFASTRRFFLSQPRLRPDSILHSNQVDVPASTMQTHHASPSARASSYATTGEIPHAHRAMTAQSLHQLTIIHTTAMQLVRTPSTTMSTTPPREFFSTFSLSRAFGSLADTRHYAIGSHTPSTTMSTTPPMDSDLTHIKGPKRLTKRELRLLD